MPYSLAPIEDFERDCQMHFACYSMCHSGVVEEGESLASIPNQRTTTHFHSDEPDITKTTASFRVSDLRSLAARDGEFADLLAKSIVVSLYARWDEFHRQQIATENLVSRKAVRSDLMGDIRLVRNCIVHANSMLTDEHRKVKQLPWALQPGRLNLTRIMMSALFNRLNREHIHVEHCPSKQ